LGLPPFSFNQFLLQLWPQFARPSPAEQAMKAPAPASRQRGVVTHHAADMLTARPDAHIDRSRKSCHPTANSLRFNSNGQTVMQKGKEMIARRPPFLRAING